MKVNLPAGIDFPQNASAHRLHSRTYSAILVGLLGLVLVWTAAFSPLPNMHNAAHDARHSFAVPCH